MSSAHAAPAWACTGCHACREACDHRNVVTDVLYAARDALAQTGVAPPAVRRAIVRFPRHDGRTRAAARAFATHPRVDTGARDALLVGCGYLRVAKREAQDAIDAATALAGGTVALVDRCCGLPLLMAGDASGFVQHAREVARSLAGRERVWIVDPGCAVALKRHYVERGVEVRPAIETLVELAARSLGALAPTTRSDEDEPIRWHDPCQLGRGLGLYDAPRQVLTRVLGRAPDELLDRRETSICSGAGGLLPSTMPGVARAIAETRLEAHRRAGGGRVVTACASSLVALRRRAVGSDLAVDDLITWIARAARPGLRSPLP